jgi:hypothetical protein
MPRMSGTEKVVAAAATIHLAIAALYAPHAPFERYIPPAIDRALAFYGNLSGAHARFNFFAPEVSNQARADFLLISRDGTSRRVRLATPNVEANRRLGLMFTVYSLPSEREPLMRAWGEYLLRQEPKAVAVEVIVEMSQIPTLEEGAAGGIVTWIEVGRMTIRRGEAAGR